MAETPSGMLNSIGLQGPGIDAFVANDLAWLKKAGARALVSIAGGTSGEFADVAARLRASAAFDAVVGVEVNISCPNVANRGLVFACDPMASAKVIALVREQLPRDMPIFAKLTPDVTDIVAIAQACVKAGADGLTMINTLLGMVIDTDRLRPQLGGRHRRALRARRSARSRSGPSGRSARRCSRAAADGADHRRRGSAHRSRRPELVAAGASAVQVGHGHLQRPVGARCASAASCAELLQDKGFERFTDAVGVAHDRTAEPMSTARWATSTFGAAAAGRDSTAHGPLCVGHRPAPGPGRGVGPAVRRRRAGALRR